MVVPWPPNQMRPQRGREKPLAAIGLNDKSLRNGLGFRIVTVVALRIRTALVYVAEIALVKDHARGAGIDKLRDPLLCAARQHIFRPFDIDGVEIPPFSPDGRKSSDMKNYIDLPAGFNHCTSISEVGLKAF